MTGEYVEALITEGRPVSPSCHAMLLTGPSDAPRFAQQCLDTLSTGIPTVVALSKVYSS
ncbi:protein of unknown function [Pararobbsia alpina]